MERERNFANEFCHFSSNQQYINSLDIWFTINIIDKQICSTRGEFKRKLLVPVDLVDLGGAGDASLRFGYNFKKLPGKIGQIISLWGWALHWPAEKSWIRHSMHLTFTFCYFLRQLTNLQNLLNSWQVQLFLKQMSFQLFMEKTIEFFLFSFTISVNLLNSARRLYIVESNIHENSIVHWQLTRRCTEKELYTDIEVQCSWILKRIFIVNSNIHTK